MEHPVVSIVKNPTAPDTARIYDMAKQAVDLLGGMEHIVKPGDVVAIKTNVFAPYPPPVSVDRRTVSAVIRLLYEAGASRVILTEAVSVGSKLGRNTSTQEVLEELGVAEAARAAGAEVLCLEDDQRILLEVPGGKSIGEIYYPKTLYDCDVLIDLPCLKMHGMTLVTLGIKNFQGILTDFQKYYAHRDDLEQKLVDIFKIRKPDLTFIDGLIGMEGNGAGEHGIPHPMNLFIASTDVVAADAVGSACMGIEDVLDVISTRLAQYDGIGCADLSKIQVVGDSIASVREPFRYPDKQARPVERFLHGVYKNVDVRIGGACRQCWYLGAGIAASLAKYPERDFVLVIGSDPKFPRSERVDMDSVIVFGDCACAATGTVKELRNQMLLEGKGVLAPGCPPYRPASAKIERYLMDRGLLSEREIQRRQQAAKQKTYDYYRSVDPTWTPKSEQDPASDISPASR